MLTNVIDDLTSAGAGDVVPTGRGAAVVICTAATGPAADAASTTVR